MRRAFYLPILVQIITLMSCKILCAQSQEDSLKGVSVKHGDKGFEFQTRDNKFLLQIQGRLQFRFSHPVDQDPLTYDDLLVIRKPFSKLTAHA